MNYELEFLQVRFLKFFPFFALLLMPAAAQKRKAEKPLPASAYKLVSVDVTGTQHYKPEDVVRASGLQIGQTVHEDDFKDAARRLGDTGAFLDVAYSFSFDPDGTKLNLQVKDAQHFAPVRFENLVWFSDQELAEKLHSQVALFNGELPVTGKLPDDLSEALQALVDEKKIPAKVDYERIAHDDGPIEAFSYSATGPRIGIRHAEFSGISPEQFPALEATAGSFRGEEYAKSRIRRQEQKTIVPVLQEQGYLKATFGEPQARVAQSEEDDVLVDVTFPVDTGAQYKLEEITISGNKVFSTDALRKLITVPLDQPANLVLFNNNVDAIKTLYGSKGYMDATIDSKPEIDDSRHTVKFPLTIHEGDVFKMGELEILGVDPHTKDRLQNNWTILTGEPYNASYTRRFVAQALQDVLKTGEWNTDIRETLDQKDKTVDVTLRFDQKP